MQESQKKIQSELLWHTKRLNYARKKWKQFIKMIHPDFFEAEPIAQRLNSKAIQKLNAFLDEHESGSTNNEGLSLNLTGSTIELECQLRDDSQTTRIRLTSVPKNISSKQREISLIKNASHLFDQLSMDYDEIYRQPVEEKTIESSTNERHFSIDQLHTFIQSTKLNEEKQDNSLFFAARVDGELYRHRIAEWMGADGIHFQVHRHDVFIRFELLNNLRLELEKVFVGLDTRYWNRKWVRQHAHYPSNEPIIQTDYASPEYDLLCKRLKGLRCFIASGFSRLDETGRLLLGIDESPRQWIHFLLKGFDDTKARQFLKRKRRIQSLERDVASRFHLKMIASGSDSVFLTDDYEQLLQDLMQLIPPATFLNRSQHGQRLSVMIRDDDESFEGFRFNHHYGFVEGNLHALSAHHLKDFLNEKGLSAMSQVQHQIQELQQLIRLTNQVRRRFSTTSVTWAANLSVFQVIQCCKFLLSRYGDAGNMLVNRRILIGETFHFSNGVLELPWNFGDPHLK
eukprot:CAMPEP_0117419578 /NCGR_PEP_ID=MMETSP0758-20121206/1106_1 /TAXON_ID=63605 /ORGANISM="Percolomonas cosmopolitus, Strain AE-1 (ATCC 50343)" /LENGTH=511 /DNA_ID=CAMNT_0005200715 /DNA_START=1136 /DNA_END=2671 /DNA_ORIENTATION=+